MTESSARIYIDALYCFSVEKKFISRKNSVFLVKTSHPDEKEKYLVCKKYSRPASMPGEIKMLCLLKKKGVPVPQIYGTGEDYILLEYLEGPLFLDYFCRQESIGGSESRSLNESAYQSIYSLCHWFKGFYRASREIAGKQLIMGDVNFRNFIMREKIYGIDLEECREGKIEEEVGSLCAFALTYDPSFTLWKMAMIGELIRVFTGELKLDKGLVKKEIKKELLVIAARRGTVKEMAQLIESRLLEKSIRFT